MSILFQNRALKHEVQHHLDSARDAEHGPHIASSPGIETRIHDDGTKNYVVSWYSDTDPQDPHNWSIAYRLETTILLILIAFCGTAGSSIDSAVQAAAAEDFHVALVTEALGGTGIFLIGFGIGALIASPASELFGRYLVYVGALAIFAIREMAAALSPDIGAQIAFRFLAGLSSSAPLTVAGGSLSDIWNAKEKTWAFPLFAIVGFGGPTLGPVIAAYIPVTGVLSWRWADWIVLILTGLVLLLVLALKEETLAPKILEKKASYFRQLTGDERSRAQSEMGGLTTMQILKKNFGRPFVLALEPIVIAFTLYLTIVYIVLFTFLDGYTYVFEMTYGINAGLSNTIFVGLFIGILLQLIAVPFVVRITNRQLARDDDEGQGTKLDRESRLLFAMWSAPLVPVGLFWMVWTDYSSISIWSPIMASVMVGAGIISIFLSAYMYIIDAYEVYAASALTFVALVRYLAAGGMTVVGVPMYENLGTHHALTILACISAAAVPIPWVLYRWGPKLRQKSKYAQ
ncbi:hypothetical protein DOTSEDRAFT_88988 [Dothistroma septosporum NZE10]|uniref:Major facilitator superfamily (MFS) profile domain-containing protein n=1 Tax=Dothistroma septosporum (strain NZE10 / CBS 128990) TaxID=675120 RepID=M2YM72_DOTSN|nr:hypothetical protein DOTSEDRAFT_88988 [Dothistroma septosporum NZE10]